MSRTITVLNAGSSSLKFSIYTFGDDPTPDLLVKGLVEGLEAAPHFFAQDGAGGIMADEAIPPDHAADAQHNAFRHLATWLLDRYPRVHLAAVGHRVVHGGTRYAEPALVDDELLAALETLAPLAPLHQPHNIACIRAVRAINPRVPQVACFDTAFHRTHARLVERYALPVRYYDAGIRRYGFHGLSYESIARALPRVAPAVAAGRVVVAHLGNGASMCALRQGRSVDTTMGFSALDGLPMGTRSGSIDPGVLLHLLGRAGMPLEELEDLLYRQSGLLGISGLSSDMRTLLASDAPESREAVDHFVFRINRELGALTAELGGLDALVFTAGIGEHSAEIRRRVCAAAAWSGIRLDDAANERGGPCISVEGTAPSAWVIPTDEEQVIALHTLAALGGAAG